MATKLAVPKLSATDNMALRIRKSEELLASLRAKAGRHRTGEGRRQRVQRRRDAQA
jgi:hypothetical protein